MKARVIVTLDCPRKCEGCVNESLKDVKVIDSKDELLHYKEIIITGGEPMLIHEKVLNFVEELRNNLNYTGKIYLHSSLYDDETMYRTYDRLLTRYLDGFNFTLHNEATDEDVSALKSLSESPTMMVNKGLLSTRLSIDNRLYDRYDFSNINLLNWTVVRKLQWLSECPLPQGEELLIFRL